MIQKFMNYSSSNDGVTWIDHPNKEDIIKKIEEVIDHVNNIEEKETVIIRVDTDKHGPEEIKELYNNVLSGKKVFVIPKDIDILLNCSTAELVSIRDKIDDLIREKEIINEM